MDHSAPLGNSSVSLGNYQPEASSAGQKEGSFCQRLITPIKNAARHIADGISTLCRNIRSFVVNICAPLTNCFRSKGSESSAPPGEQSSHRMSDEKDRGALASNSAAPTEKTENTGNSQRNAALPDDNPRDPAGANENEAKDQLPDSVTTTPADSPSD